LLTFISRWEDVRAVKCLRVCIFAVFTGFPNPDNDSGKEFSSCRHSDRSVSIFRLKIEKSQKPAILNTAMEALLYFRNDNANE